MSRRFLRMLLAFVVFAAAAAWAQSGGELRFCLHTEPKTFNPILAEDDASETVRYLTGGVLIRVDRLTQEAAAELATSWKVTNAGKTITFKLREGVRFSDGSSFSAEDVAYTMQQLMDPSLHSPTGDAFRAGEGKIETHVLAPNRIAITFPAPIAGLEKLFDQVAIMSAHSPKKEMAVLGPYYTAEYKAGSYVQLQRNPNYWRRDPAGRQLPYIDAVHMDIQTNRDTEILRLLRG
ncbi:MAG TPA: ABC transporter substrate-binding protein, partial [Terriglobales bacterium]|nr:ABC transporter substrate-binding protein [Terriglobales bacterium]